MLLLVCCKSLYSFNLHRVLEGLHADPKQGPIAHVLAGAICADFFRVIKGFKIIKAKVDIEEEALNSCKVLSSI